MQLFSRYIEFFSLSLSFNYIIIFYYINFNFNYTSISNPSLLRGINSRLLFIYFQFLSLIPSMTHISYLLKLGSYILCEAFACDFPSNSSSVSIFISPSYDQLTGFSSFRFQMNF